MGIENFKSFPTQTNRRESLSSTFCLSKFVVARIVPFLHSLRDELVIGFGRFFCTYDIGAEGRVDEWLLTWKESDRLDE